MQDQNTQLKLRSIYNVNIKNYQIITKINEGGFGYINLVKNKETDELYAAKVIRYLSEKSIYKQMINREISIMMRVHHPTLIKFYGYSLEDFDGNKNVTILMEFLKKGSLSEYLKKVKDSQADQDYDNTKRQIILIGIARGMSFLHKNKILHRDLKPSNILLDDNLQPHIIDFGFSKFYEKNKPNSSIQQCGTRIYMAPETIKDNQYDEKTDVYSFAILMFEVVTDQIPYPELHNKAMTEFVFNKKVVEEFYRPTFNVPVKESIKKLIESCWSPNPSERPTFDEIFNKLAFNNENWIIDVYEGSETQNEYDINKYFLENVNVDDVFSYVDEVREVSPIDELKRENEEIKQQINEIKKQQKRQLFEFKNVVTISSFNALSIDSQLAIISELSESNQELAVVFDDLNTLLKYFIEKKAKKDGHYLHIQSNNCNELLLNVDKIFEVRLLSGATDILIKNKSFASTIFRKKIKPFKTVFIDLKYPSDTFDSICSQVSAFKESKNKKNVEIGIYITGIVQTDLKFRGNELINYVIFDSTVKGITSKIVKTEYDDEIHGSFQNCSSLTKVEMASSIIMIGEYAFSECKLLKDIQIPLSVTFIGECAFNECESLTSVKIPPSVITIEKCAFWGCISLTGIEIPSSVKSICDGTFAECKSLRNVEIPKSVVSIGNDAFNGCISLLFIYIPSSVNHIGNDAFGRCESLSHISMPSKMKTENIGAPSKVIFKYY